MRLTAGVVLVLVLSACAFMDGEVRGGRVSDMTGCDDPATRFAFNGQATLAELGLGDFGGDSNRRGQIWVTLDRVDMHGPGGRPPGLPLELTRVVCVEWPDGSGMVGSIDDNWQPPGAVAIPEPAGDGAPWGLVAVVAVIGLIGGVSFFAFREKKPVA